MGVRMSYPKKKKSLLKESDGVTGEVLKIF